MMYFGNEGVMKYDIMSLINATMEQPLVMMWFTSTQRGKSAHRKIHKDREPDAGTKL